MRYFFLFALSTRTIRDLSGGDLIISGLVRPMCVAANPFNIETVSAVVHVKGVVPVRPYIQLHDIAIELAGMRSK